MKYITILAILFASCQQKPNPQIKVLENRVDSLLDANHYLQIELNRYQTGYLIFINRNPKAANQLGQIISDETE
jgi:hypothetical protein